MPVSATILEIDYRVTVTFRLTQDLKHVILNTIVGAHLKQAPAEQEAPLLAEIDVQTAFATIGLETLLTEANELMLPEPFALSFVNVAIGTTRGILFAKNFGTRYSPLILPLLDGKPFIPAKPFDLNKLGEPLGLIVSPQGSENTYTTP